MTEGTDVHDLLHTWARRAALAATVAALGLSAPDPASAVPSVPWPDGVRGMAWGRNDGAQLGDGTQIDRALPGQISGMPNSVRQVAGGERHSLALLADGTVWSWGRAGYGALGDGSGLDQATPVRVADLTGVTQVAAGFTHSLALKSDGTVWAWGYNREGVIGDGSVTDRYTPVQVPGISNAIQIAAGGYSSYALRADGTVLAWGDNFNGQLGDGTITDRPSPVVIPGLTGISQIAAGHFHALALRSSSGTVLGWGFNQHGALGDHTFTSRRSPVPVVGLNSVIHIGAGSFFSLAVRKDRVLWSWGNNGYGQLGDDGPSRSIAQPVSGITSVAQVTGGHSFTLAVRTDGTLWSWGQNQYGQLGDGTLTDHTAPARVLGVSGVRMVDAGVRHSLVVMREPDVVLP